MKRKCLAVGIILLSIGIALPNITPVGGIEPKQQTTTMSAGLEIDGNQDFTPEHHVESGTGTIDDPYIIRNLIIHQYNYGIIIKNTTAYFDLINCSVYNCDMLLAFSNVTHGTARDCLFGDVTYWDAIHIEDGCSDILFENCDIYRNTFGVDIDNTNNCRFINCLLLYNTGYFQLGRVLRFKYCSNISILNCYFEHNNQWDIEFNSGYCNNITIENCTFNGFNDTGGICLNYCNNTRVQDCIYEKRGIQINDGNGIFINNSVFNSVDLTSSKNMSLNKNQIKTMNLFAIDSLRIYHNNINRISPIKRSVGVTIVQNNIWSSYITFNFFCQFINLSGNYWGRLRIFPKIVIGFPKCFFDLTPAHKPYNITGMSKWK
jgi:hypothetical protein